MTRLSAELAILLTCATFVPSCTDGDDNCYNGECDLALASELPEQCSLAMIRIERPVSSDDLVGGSYSYGFRFKAPTEPSAPVLVFLPGGPGQSSTSQVPSFVPESWGYLLTDSAWRWLQHTREASRRGCLLGVLSHPRYFTGCGRGDKGFRALTNYIVFGISYGTVLGTTVVHELELERVPPPRAVVLEGVLGKAFEAGFVGAEYITQWDCVRTRLPADVLAELDTKSAPYDVPAAGWSRYLMELLNFGPEFVASDLAGLSSTAPEDVRRATLAGIEGVAAETGAMAEGEEEMLRQIACRELDDTLVANGLFAAFQAGKLVRNTTQEGTLCKNLTLTDPYDSADLQSAPKVYYFLGDSDVATPFSQGTYHYDHRGGAAVKITTIDGGHNSLQFNQMECAPALMASIAAGGADLSTALASCPLATNVEQK